MERSKVVFERNGDSVIAWINDEPRIWIKASRYKLENAFKDFDNYQGCPCLVIKRRDNNEEIAFLWLDSGNIHIL